MLISITIMEGSQLLIEFLHMLSLGLFTNHECKDSSASTKKCKVKLFSTSKMVLEGIPTLCSIMEDMLLEESTKSTEKLSRDPFEIMNLISITFKEEILGRLA